MNDLGPWEIQSFKTFLWGERDPCVLLIVTSHNTNRTTLEVLLGNYHEDLKYKSYQGKKNYMTGDGSRLWFLWWDLELLDAAQLFLSEPYDLITSLS